MKLLVVTGEPITAAQLRDAVPDGTARKEVEVVVVAPALQQDALHFWLDDVDDAIARADEVQRETAARLDDAGVAVSANTGASDPQQAIEDALVTFTADRIVLFERRSDEQRYREGMDVAELEQRLGVPVDCAHLSPRR